MRNFIEKTRNDYIRCSDSFTAFLRHSPDTAMPKHDPGELEGFALTMQRNRCNAVISENGMVRAVLQPCHQAKLARGIEDESP